MIQDQQRFILNLLTAAQKNKLFINKLRCTLKKNIFLDTQLNDSKMIELTKTSKRQQMQAMTCFILFIFLNRVTHISQRIASSCIPIEGWSFRHPFPCTMLISFRPLGPH